MPTTLRQTQSPSSQGLSLILPVSPGSNARNRFASTLKTTPAMSPNQALAWLARILARGTTIDTVEISGPGDPLATPEYTLETLRLLRRRHPGLKLSLSTLGLFGDLYAQALAENGVSRVTLLIDAVDPEVVKKIYAWIRPARQTVPLAKAAEILVSEQATALAAFKQAGIEVHVKATLYPGVNDDHIEEIARQTASLGVKIMSIVPCLAREEDLEGPRSLDRELLGIVRALAAKHLSIVELPKAEECAPDSATASVPATPHPAPPLPGPSRERPNVAVVSSNGMEVDLHLGQARRVMIYGPREDGLACLLRTRLVPEAGGGSSRWEKLAVILSDCFALLAASAGENPRRLLGDRGITVLLTDGNIEGTVDVLYGGGKKSTCRQERLNQA